MCDVLGERYSDGCEEEPKGGGHCCSLVICSRAFNIFPTICVPNPKDTF